MGPGDWGASGSPVMEDSPAAPLITCDEDGIAYLLSASMIEGTDLDDAGAAIPQNQVNYVVTLSFNGAGTERLYSGVTNSTASASPSAWRKVL